MIEKIKIRWVYILCVLFIALNSFLVIKEQYWGFLLPVVLLLLLLYIYSLDKVLMIITFATPLAVLYKDDIYGIGASIPTEPLLLGILLVFTLRQLYIHDFDKKVWKHPLSIAIIANLLWLLITTCTSELPLVSVKFLLSRLWFVIPFYFVISQLFKSVRNIKIFYWLYTIPLIGVIGFTIYNHSLWGFAEEPGHWVMTPFYNDHTAYGAILAMYIPVMLGLAFNKSFTKTSRLFSILAFGILIIAIFLSYSRAAWVSLVASLMLFILVYYKIKLRVVLFGIVSIVVLFVGFQTQIFQKLEKNKQDSSSNIVEHVQSISNISSDASNLERINRWNSAFRMFYKRPVLGWGPGTYQFLYAPFQNSKERTIISTNAGDKGNAHSEYIGPLAESGFMGMLTFLAIALISIVYGIRVYRTAADREVRLLSLLMILSLFTYYIHGFLNNFLDTDKASIPFWGFCAVILALDLYQPKADTK